MTQRDDLIATLVILAVAGVGMVVLLPPDIFSFAYWQEGGDSTSRSEVFRNLGLAAIALGALIVGSIRAWSAHRQARTANEQARIAQQGQITNLFSTAVEHLGSEQLPVRLGGIYALWRLIKDSPDRVISVIDILCAFVRHPPHEPAQGPDPGASEDERVSAEKAEKAGSKTEIRPDVQTVLDRIGTKKAVYRALLPDGYHLDLTGANLTRARLRDADLTGANLTGALLTNAFLMDAFLKDVYLTDADLTGANLTGANLTGANLAGADLTGANLTGANLAIANLAGAKLTAANLTGAHLGRANLTDANLTDANLNVATLWNADLKRANLAGADLWNADLAGANLWNANLADADLSGANFDNAKNVPDLSGFCADPVFPPRNLSAGVNPPELWPCSEIVKK